MVITVSDTNGIKQYTAPRSIKKILLFVLLFILLFIGGLFYYIQSLTSQVIGLESNNKTLTEQMQKDSSMREAFEEKQLELDTIKKEKLEVETKLEQEKVVLEKKLEKEKTVLEKKLKEKIDQLVIKNKKIENQNKLTHEEKSESDKLLDELTKEIKQIEKELEEEIKIKESLRKKLSLKIKKEKLKKEKDRKVKLAKKKKAKKAKLAKKEKAKKAKLAKKEKAKKAKLAKKEKEHKKKLAKRKLKREDLLRRIAKTKLGKRYVWGAVGPRTFDCSGFTSYVYKKTGVNIPRTSREQSKYGKYIKRKSLKPGDLIFFDTSRRRKGIVNHVGIYLGNNKFIHASSAKKRVVVTSLGKPFYSSRYKWARRVVN